MKTQKMKLLVKRLPTDGLYDLHEVLLNEMNSRKEGRNRIKNIPASITNFFEKTLPKELKNDTTT